MSFILECFAMSGRIVTFVLCFGVVAFTAITMVAAIAKCIEMICDMIAERIDYKEETT